MTLSTPLRCACALALIFGCSSAPPPAPEPPADDAAALQARRDYLLRRTSEIKRRLAALRGLPFTQEVDQDVLTKAQLKEFLVAQIEKEYPGGKLKDLARALEALDLVPPGFDLQGTMLGVLDEQIAGFYDPETGRLRLIDRPSLPAAGGVARDAMEHFVLAHELLHALQDQHFNLREQHERREGNDDERLALTALIEGEAVVGALDSLLYPAIYRTGWLIQLLLWLGQDAVQESLKGEKALAEAPPYLRRQLVFPYLEGGRFANIIKTRYGSDAWTRAFQDDPPRSSEQILHPERYWFRPDPPVAVSLPELALPAGARLLEENTLGELGTAVLLSRRLGEREAAGAAEGWAGDRFRVYDVAGELLLVWVSEWDDRDQAQRFFRAYARAAAERHGDMKLHTDKDRVLGGESAKQSLRVQRWHERVLVALGPRALVDDLLVSSLGAARADRTAHAAAAARFWRVPPLANLLLDAGSGARDRWFELLSGAIFHHRVHADGHEGGAGLNIIYRSQSSSSESHLRLLGGYLFEREAQTKAGASRWNALSLPLLGGGLIGREEDPLDEAHRVRWTFLWFVKI